MLIVHLFDLLGLKKTAFKRAFELRQLSNRDRLRPGWSQKRHDELSKYVDAADFRGCTKCGKVYPKSYVVHVCIMRTPRRQRWHDQKGFSLLR